ncbi:UDP-glucuronosyltransferase 2B17-like [Tubulanus polymorphus]|uniref:UDP-glucuronosyltransferase 2B17-like n=1 Tax=Tubulanus polymorphus TaxID=672921 RepID=UPI003DA27E92
MKFWAFGLLLWASISTGKRIIVFSPLMSGQLGEASGICDALIKSGHEVYIVTEEHVKYPRQLKHVTGLKYLHFRSPVKETLAPKTLENKLAEFIFEEIDLITFMKKMDIQSFTNYFGECLLNDTHLLKNIRQLNFDFAIFDSFMPFLGIIPYIADIPYASWSPLTTPFRMNLPPLTGFEPCDLYGDRNTFFNRIKHLFQALFFQNIPYFMTNEARFVKWIQDNHPSHALKRSLTEIVSNSKFFILATNNLLDCPAPLNPDIVYAGGLSVHPPKPLSKEVEKIVQAANDGIIVFTLGSTVSKMPNNVLVKFIDAFKKVKQTVLWRLTLSEDQKDIVFPSNVKIMEWLPQNDLLGNPKTRLFITHSGANGQAEALYHGVPVIGFPIHADQIYNAKKFAMRGYGLELNIRKFESDELLRAIHEILSNPKYKNKIEWSSKIFKSGGLASKNVAEMVDHVLEFGVEHLKTAGDQMEWYQFYMIDMFLFVVVTGLLCLYASYRIARRCLGYCFSSKKKTE